MQSRRAQGLTPLAIVMPHPSLSLRSPHTPRSCPSPIVYPAANRKSTDSWNSSNADELEFEWKPEQILLLQRTLDALPRHLVTPFHGPVPPSNLLDKIARGVSQAKGPLDWPHSIRATRVKLLELARNKAVVAVADDENDNEPRRPIYRQSSMDFIKPTPADLKANPAIARLSSRLQRTDRLVPNMSFHPYHRAESHRSASPPLPSDVPPLVDHTSSSTTLSTIPSNPRLARTASSMSTFSNSSDGLSSLPDPRIQRLRRSESVSNPPQVPFPQSGPPRGFKRAPSYGMLAQDAKQGIDVAGQVHVRRLSGSYPSSDEEEKARAKKSKKAKTKSPSPGPPALSEPAGPPVPPKDKVKTPKQRLNGVGSPSGRKDRPVPMNLQRNPSMFGAELPCLAEEPVMSLAPAPVFRRSPISRKFMDETPPPSPARNAMTISPPAHDVSIETPPMTPMSPTSPATQKTKTLRRVKRLPPARRISFSKLAPGDEADGESEEARESSSLGSAFQLA